MWHYNKPIHSGFMTGYTYQTHWAHQNQSGVWHSLWSQWSWSHWKVTVRPVIHTHTHIHKCNTKRWNVPLFCTLLPIWLKRCTRRTAESFDPKVSQSLGQNIEKQGCYDQWITILMTVKLHKLPSTFFSTAPFFCTSSSNVNLVFILFCFEQKHGRE